MVTRHEGESECEGRVPEGSAGINGCKNKLVWCVGHGSEDDMSRDETTEMRN